MWRGVEDQSRRSSNVSRRGPSGAAYVGNLMAEVAFCMEHPSGYQEPPIFPFLIVFSNLETLVES